jgi:hypothetical protein
MNQNSNQQTDITMMDERLARTFYFGRRYNPVLIAVVGIGFLSIYLLTLLNILGESAPQLPFIGALTLLYALAEIPLLTLAQEGKGIAANFYATIAAGVLAVLITLLWQGIIWIAIPIAAATPLLALRNGLPRKYRPGFLWLLAAIIGSIFLAEAKSPFERLQNSNSAAIASIVFLIATTLLLLTIAVISQNRKFRSLQGLLLTSFVMIVTIPTVLTAVLSALGAYAAKQ